MVVINRAPVHLLYVESYSIGANCFIDKPASAEDFLDVVLKIEEFWIEHVKLSSGKSD